MADFNIQGMRNIQHNLEIIGKDHVGLAGGDQVQGKTAGAAGRFFGRVAAFFGSGTRTENRETIATLARSIRDTPALGQRYADVFSGKAATLLADGKPLSGRKIAAVLAETLNQAQDAFVVDNTRRETMLEMTAAFLDGNGANSFDGMTAEFEEFFELTPEQSGFAGKQDEIKDKIMERLAQKTAGRQATYDDAREIGREVVQEAAIDAYVETNLDDFAAGMRKRQILGDDVEIDNKKLASDLTSALKSAMDREEPHILAAIKAKLDLSADVQGRLIRGGIVRERSASLLALDDSKDGLLAAYRARADKLSPDLVMADDALVKIQEKITARLRNEFGGGEPPPPLPDGQTIKERRDEYLDQYFAGVQKMADSVPEAGGERARFLKTCLATAPILKPAVLDYVMDLSKAAEKALESALVLTDPEDLREVMLGLGKTMTALRAELNKKPGMQEFGAEDNDVAGTLAFQLAVERFAAGGNILMAGLQMSRIGSPFIDLLVTERRQLLDNESPGMDHFTVCNNLALLLSTVAGHMPKTIANKLDAEKMTYADASFEVKKNVLQNNPPEGFRFDDDMGFRQARQDINNNYRDAMNTALTEGSQGLPPNVLQNPNHPDWTFGDSFRVDYPRGVYLVNGRHLRAKDEKDVAAHNRFVGMFPDRRAAVQISRLFAQWSHQALIVELGKLDKFKEKALLNKMFFNTQGGASENFTQSVEPVPGHPGRYRIVSEADFHSGEDPKKAKENGNPMGYHFRTEMIVQTGNNPSVLSVESDILFYGHEEG